MSDLTRAMNACNACDGPITTPNRMGYCDECLASAQERTVEAGCTGNIDKRSGLFQHDGDTCPIHEDDDDEVKLTLDQAVAKLADKYQLIYTDYRDQLNEEQVDHVVSGDYESLWESLEEYESEATYSGIQYVIDDVFSTEEWESLSDEDQQGIRDAIQERDESPWIDDLARNTPDPLLRIVAVDEDDAWSFQPVETIDVLDKINFKPTEHNIKVMQRALDECSPEFSVLMGYWVVAIDLQTIYKAPDDAKFRITNPHLYLGNPVMGSGWITEEPLHGTVMVSRDQLHTDKKAFGCSLDSIYGGLRVSEFDCEVEVLTDQAISEEDQRNEERVRRELPPMIERLETK